MILLQAQAVARHFGADVLFSNVNLDIQDNSRIGLVGKNGAGKSTLISMLLGDSEPDEGQIVRKKGLTIGYLAQTTGLDSDRTVFEEMKSVFAYLQEMEVKLHQLEEHPAGPWHSRALRDWEEKNHAGQADHRTSEI